MYSLKGKYFSVQKNEQFLSNYREPQKFLQIQMRTCTVFLERLYA